MIFCLVFIYLYHISYHQYQYIWSFGEISGSSISLYVVQTCWLFNYPTVVISCRDIFNWGSSIDLNVMQTYWLLNHPIVVISCRDIFNWGSSIDLNVMQTYWIFNHPMVVISCRDIFNWGSSIDLNVMQTYWLFNHPMVVISCRDIYNWGIKHWCLSKKVSIGNIEIRCSRLTIIKTKFQTFLLLCIVE